MEVVGPDEDCELGEEPLDPTPPDPTPADPTPAGATVPVGGDAVPTALSGSTRYRHTGAGGALAREPAAGRLTVSSATPARDDPTSFTAPARARSDRAGSVWGETSSPSTAQPLAGLMESTAPDANVADTDATAELVLATASTTTPPLGSRAAAEATTENGRSLAPPDGTNNVSTEPLADTVTWSSLATGQIPTKGIALAIAARIGRPPGEPGCPAEEPEIGVEPFAAPVLPDEEPEVPTGLVVVAPPPDGAPEVPAGLVVVPVVPDGEPGVGAGPTVTGTRTGMPEAWIETGNEKLTSDAVICNPSTWRVNSTSEIPWLKTARQPPAHPFAIVTP